MNAPGADLIYWDASTYTYIASFGSCVHDDVYNISYAPNPTPFTITQSPLGAATTNIVSFSPSYSTLITTETKTLITGTGVNRTKLETYTESLLFPISSAPTQIIKPKATPVGATYEYIATFPTPYILYSVVEVEQEILTVIHGVTTCIISTASVTLPGPVLETYNGNGYADWSGRSSASGPLPTNLMEALGSQSGLKGCTAGTYNGSPVVDVVVELIVDAFCGSGLIALSEVSALGISSVAASTPSLLSTGPALLGGPQEEPETPTPTPTSVTSEAKVSPAIALPPASGFGSASVIATPLPPNEEPTPTPTAVASTSAPELGGGSSLIATPAPPVKEPQLTLSKLTDVAPAVALSSVPGLGGGSSLFASPSSPIKEPPPSLTTAASAGPAVALTSASEFGDSSLSSAPLTSSKAPTPIPISSAPSQETVPFESEGTLKPAPALSRLNQITTLVAAPETVAPAFVLTPANSASVQPIASTSATAFGGSSPIAAPLQPVKEPFSTPVSSSSSNPPLASPLASVLPLGLSSNLIAAPRPDIKEQISTPKPAGPSKTTVSFETVPVLPLVAGGSASNLIDSGLLAGPQETPQQQQQEQQQQQPPTSITKTPSAAVSSRPSTQASGESPLESVLPSVISKSSTALPTQQLPIITFNSSPITANARTEFLISGETLVPGGHAITVSGTVLSFETSATAVVVGSNTLMLNPTPSSTSSEESATEVNNLGFEGSGSIPKGEIGLVLLFCSITLILTVHEIQ